MCHLRGPNLDFDLAFSLTLQFGSATALADFGILDVDLGRFGLGLGRFVLGLGHVQLRLGLAVVELHQEV